jgi:4-hydroxythreonine-4-phosphate dehydrogenase
MLQAVKLLDKELKIHPVQNLSEAYFEYGTIDVYDLHNVDLSKLQYGVVSAMAGEAAFEAVRCLIDLAMTSQIDATVTAPINKESIHKAGHNFSGHTEIYAHYTNTKNYAMLLADDALRVIHVSTHVSLRQACDRGSKARVLDVIELLHKACVQFGIQSHAWPWQA